MTLLIWDASHYDGTLTRAILARAAAEGIVGLTHKLGEGLADTEGSHDDTALAAARDVGMVLVGGYWVVRTAPPAADQVDALIRLADAGEPWWRDFGGWVWQTDLERWSYDNVSAAKGIDFARRLRDKTGRQVLLYASHSQYADQLAAWDGPLWNADYASRPVGTAAAMYPGDGWRPQHQGWVGGWAPYSGREPAILQYTSSATIAGLTTCDANAYRGTREQLLALIRPGGAPTTGDDMASVADTITYEIRPWTAGTLQGVGRLEAAAAEDKTRDAGMLVAIEALAAQITAGGGSVDVAAITAAVQAEAATTRTLVEQLQAQLAAANTELVELRQALGAGAQAEAEALAPKTS